MRGNIRNDGVFRRQPSPQSTLPIRHFRTGNSVFSTPVVGKGDVLYVGSADHIVYAFDPVHGTTRWQHELGELIDSGGCIGADGSVYIPAADGLYRFNPDGTVRWHLDVLARNERFTPSTIYWFEGNVVMGPNGWLYIGCDDFHIYAIDPENGEVQWAVRTGCCVWTAGVFGPDDTVYFASFDCHLYAMDLHTGRIKWTKNLSNFVVSSPAVGQDGTLYVGSFDGKIYAINGKTGDTLWSIQTDAPVYASPALAENGMLYIGSSDGKIYCIDTAERAVAWTFYTGDPVRSSAALGPDPEGRHPYLIYVGGGNGLLYALEPTGKRRWSYNTLAGAEKGTQYCNINAATVLGDGGVATASANGDVIYVPYDFYLREPTHAGMCMDPTDGFPQNGVFACSLSIGGIPASPTTQEPVRIRSGETVSLRLLKRKNGDTTPIRLQRRSLKTGKQCYQHDAILSPEGNQVNIVPHGLQEPGRYSLRIELPYTAEGKKERFRTAIPIEVLPAPAEFPGIRTLPPMRITQMSIYDPAIVPSFDQIAIASLAIEVRIIDHDERTGKVLGWGVQKFGVDSSGNASVGIPNPRFFFFAFHGTYKNGALELECRNCLYEITAFPVPLSRLRFSATYSGESILAGSMLAETRIGLLSEVWKRVRNMQLPYISDVARFSWRQLGAFLQYLRSWFPRNPAPADAGRFFYSCGQLLLLGWEIMASRIWEPWGLLDREGRFCGVGTFRAVAPVFGPHPNLEVTSLRYHRHSRQIIAEFRALPGARADAVPGIVLYDHYTMDPVAINYSEWIVTDRDAQGIPVRTTLLLPPSVRLFGKRLRATVLIDLDVRASIELHNMPRLRRERIGAFFRACMRGLSFS
jgi:outer membrane protein assembly factor BamB